MNGLATALLLWRRTSCRHWRLAPGQTLLLVTILALGVAVFVAVRLANRAAVGSFQHFTDTLTGQSDWIIRAPAGPLPEDILFELREKLGDEPVHIIPVLEINASPPVGDRPEEGFGRPSYTLLGVDLVALGNLALQRASARPFFHEAPARGHERQGSSFWDSLDGRPRVWLSPEWPEEPLPDQLALVIDDQVVSVPVAGEIPLPDDAPQPPWHLIVGDLPGLQRLSGRLGEIDRVELVVEPGPRLEERRAALGTRLETISEGRWLVTTLAAREESAATMTQAFRLNLTVLSLIALLVGLYLVFQALDGAVVRRRGEIAILRSLGVEEGTIRKLWLVESAALGVFGGALGVIIGWLGAQGAVQAVGRTVNALYFATTVEAAHLEPREAIGGLLLGVVASLIAGWYPARIAARTPPAQVMQRSATAPAGVRRGIRAIGALLLLATGMAAAMAPPVLSEGGARFPLGGYLAALCWIGGGGLFAGVALPSARHVLFTGRGRPSVTVALGHLRQPSGRHRLAVAALHCAIGMTAGMVILVASFDQTVRGWVARSLQADLYLSSEAVQSASARGRISPATVEQLQQHPAVAALHTQVVYPVFIDGRETQLRGSDLAAIPERIDLTWIKRPEDTAIFDANRNAGLALISESFAERFRVTVGDEVTLPTPAGSKRVRVSGIFADYGNERGSLLVDRTHLRQWFQDDHVTNVSLWLREGANADAVRADLARAFPALSIYTHARLRDEILRVFRQTFAITYALEVIGVVVALVGLALTLTSVLLDRREELTTLRALGFSRGELRAATAWEGGAVAFVAALGGLALSFGLGWVLIYVINKQSFGWTLGFAVPWSSLLLLLAGITCCGLVVGAAVGGWAAALPADREEE